MKAFTERFNEAFNKSGMTQMELVRATGISKTAICFYLQGKREPKQDAIYLLSKALRVNEAWLMGHDTDMERPLYRQIQDQLLDLSDEQLQMILDLIKVTTKNRGDK